MLYCNKSTGSTGYSRQVLSKWILPASARSAALMVLLSAGLLTATSALAVDNSAFGYAGSASGKWAKPGNVIGSADGNCANMGAEGKVNLTSGFGFSIPDGATITGVTARVKGGENGGQDVNLQLASQAAVEPPTLLGTPEILGLPATGGNCAPTTVVPAGGSLASKWGSPVLSPGIVNDPAFGVVFTKIVPSSVKVDAICLEITYTTEAVDGGQNLCFGEVVPKTPTIRVVKVLEGEAPGTDWGYTGGLGDFTIGATGGSQTFIDLNNDTYTITETTKAGWTVTSECTIADLTVSTGDSSIDVAVTGSEIANCTFTNTRQVPPAGPAAYVTVNKVFVQPAGAAPVTTPVTFSLVCVSGTVSPSSVTLTPPYTSPGHIFSVNDINPQVFDNKCTVTETPIAGWTPTAYCVTKQGDGSPDERCTNPPAARLSQCVFTDVRPGDEAECTIENNAAPVVVEVTKIWDETRSGGLDYDRDATISIFCDAQILGGSRAGPNWVVRHFLDDSAGDYEDKDGKDIGEATVTARVIPTWYATNPNPTTANPQKVTKCWAEETIADDAVESVSTCGKDLATATMKVPVGGPGGTCEITNTVFFEGIPTLNQYGMAIMALLMLGLGAMGIRRFV